MVTRVFRAATPSPAMADPLVRRSAHTVAVLQFVFSAPCFLGAGFVLYLFLLLSLLGGSGGWAVVYMVVGGLVAALPGLPGVAFVRSGLMLWRGDVGYARWAVRLHWIVAVLGALATCGAVPAGEGYGAVAVLAPAVTVGCLVSLLLLKQFEHQVAAYERARAGYPPPP